ncbi:hypothetical protein O6H91_11G004400 [Diphasiastrum complanatum]|uniref:Uncharacterized protein n=1 Tax=Diphasiastrum complanatum TaxID=34168 RepID=A0ACC2C5V0_DIPCM|nr:hypothetical protein O6H91_11G004400 [Diphasiastrum complanatum]
MAAKYWILLLVLQLLVVETMVLADAQPLEKSLGKDDSDQEAVEEEIIASLEKAQQSLQMADTVRATIGNCKAAISTAVGALDTVEMYLLQYQYTQSISKLSNIKRSLSECNSALAVSNATTKIDEADELLAWLVGKSPKTIEDRFQPSNNINSLEDNSYTGKEVCIPDGTRCQFSECGQGKKLASCAFGFASGVTGGTKGQDYVVTSPDDNPKSPEPGTLRYAVGLGGNDNGGVWIKFGRDMEIVLKEMLWVRSSTTIDGRGVNVSITGRNIVLGGITNVILHNFQISSLGESDTVHIFSGSTKIWVDHLTSFDAKLGLISVLQGSTDVTISNSFLKNPNFNMLLGASDADLEDKIMRVTVFRNWFKDSMQRMPHCRWGLCHVINNLFTNWGYYAIGARVHAKVVSENNVFIAGRRTEVTPWFEGITSEFDSTATIQSTHDLLLNGTTFHQFRGAGTLTASPYQTTSFYPPVHPTGTLPALVQSCSGALFGKKLQQCLLPSF